MHQKLFIGRSLFGPAGGAHSAPQTSYLDWGRPTDMHAGGEESKKGTEAKKRGYMGKKGWKQNGKGWDGMGKEGTEGEWRIYLQFTPLPPPESEITDPPGLLSSSSSAAAAVASSSSLLLLLLLACWRVLVCKVTVRDLTLTATSARVIWVRSRVHYVTASHRTTDVCIPDSLDWSQYVIISSSSLCL